jgi:hypothetical protein
LPRGKVIAELAGPRGHDQHEQAECEKKLLVKGGAFAIFAAVHRFWCAGNWFYPAERTST